jgi:hypothetical protein
MSNIDKHIQNKEDKLDALQSSLQQIQEQLLLLQQELRVEKQLAEAQKTIAGELTSKKAGIKKLMKDMCSCYPVEALDDVLQDLQEIKEEVAAEYEAHSVSDRFLNLDSATEEDAQQEDLSSYTLLPQALPDVTDDNTLLTPENLKQILEEVSDEILSKVQSMYGVSSRMKIRSNIYVALSKAGVTRAKLDSLLQLLTPATLAGSNGKSL